MSLLDAPHTTHHSYDDICWHIMQRWILWIVVCCLLHDRLASQGTNWRGVFWQQFLNKTSHSIKKTWHRSGQSSLYEFCNIKACLQSHHYFSPWIGTWVYSSWTYSIGVHGHGWSSLFRTIQNFLRQTSCHLDEISPNFIIQWYTFQLIERILVQKSHIYP